MIACLLYTSLDGAALGQHHLDVRIIEVAGGEAHAGTDDLHDLLHELVGALACRIHKKSPDKFMKKPMPERMTCTIFFMNLSGLWLAVSTRRAPTSS